MKNIIKLLFSTCIVAGIILFWCKKPSSQTSNNILRVGMMDGWAPFMVVNNKGDFEGFDVDIAQTLATKLGKKLEIINLGSLAPLFIALEQNKIDMIFSGLDITEKRQKELAMIRYTGENVNSWRLVFWERIPATVTSLQDLQVFPDAIVCVEAGSSQEKYLDSLPAIMKKNLGSVSAMIMDIKFGKSTALLLEPTIAKQYKKQNPELKMLEVPLPNKYQVFGCGIALKKDNTSLAQQVTRSINELKKEGIMQAYEKKWNLEGA